MYRLDHVLVITILGVFSATRLAAEPLLSGEDWLQQLEGRIQHVDTAKLSALIEKTPSLEFLDVRTPDEAARSGGIISAGKRTHNIVRGWLEFQVRDAIPDLSTPIVVYCGTNRRSPLAADTLQRIGYTHVYNYQDGFGAWQQANLPVKRSDLAVGSMLFDKPSAVVDGVWSAIGATAPPTFENSGHNNNLSFIVTSEGVVVVNAGDNYLLAAALHQEIKAITDQAVKFVVLENGQGHAMLGMNYWQEQGAEVIAHVDAADVIAERGETVLQRMQLRNRDKAMGTVLSMPDITFDERYDIELGDTKIEVLYLGPAHSPGDIVVHIPDRQTVIAGDMAFHERLLPVFEDTDTVGWLESWHHFEALSPTVVVPGHGHPTTVAEVKIWTVDYLKFMRSEIAELLDTGGSLIDAYKIDQSAFAHLDTFDELAGLNADRIFRAMEFE